MSGRSTSSWLLLLTCGVLSALCLNSYTFAVVDGSRSQLSVKFTSTPLLFSSVPSATFQFEALVGQNGDICTNCTAKCKLDDQIPSKCESGEVSYVGLRDGQHAFEVCINASQGVQCASYNWTIDTVPPTAYITSERSFTNALNVSVNISFNEPCSMGGGFGCLSVNACNLLVYGAGHVIPSTLKILQPDLRFSLLVGLSPSVQYGRILLVMDKNFCTDFAGNKFARTENSSFYLHFDRRSVFVDLRTHVPERLIKLNNQPRTVEATNNLKNLKVYLYFTQPIVNSSYEILRVLHSSDGFLLPTNRNNLGNRRFGYLVKNVSSISVVTISLDTSSLISRQGTPVSPTEPVAFLFDSKRPSVDLSTTSITRTRENCIPVLIKFAKPVLDFNSSAIWVSGGHLQSFRELSRSIYTVDIHAVSDLISVNIPENISGDVAGNKNLASNVLQVRHYSMPRISLVLSTIVTAAIAMTSLASGFLTVSTASLQSLGALSRPTRLTSDPSRNLFRIICHIQVFAQSRWLAVILPIEYYEFVRGLQWSIPHLGLPWDAGHVPSIMLDSGSTYPIMTHSELPGKLGPEISEGLLSGSVELDIDASLYGLPLTPMEYTSFFKSYNIKPEADKILGSQNSNGWKEFKRNIFWLAVIGGGLVLLHAVILYILKCRRDMPKQKNYGALVFPRFEILLVFVGLPCLCQASGAIIKGGSTSGLIVGVMLLGIVTLLLLSLLLFLSIGITMNKLLQYKEVHREGRTFHWYQELVRVTLGPGKRGQWSWKNQPNSPWLTMLGPMFEDLRGPPKYMLSQIADRNPGKMGDRIIASDDETEDAEAPFIQKLFGILRIYYIFLESLKRVALGIIAGAFISDWSSKFPSLILLCITSFQLFFLVLKKPFIKKRVQFVEILCVCGELGIFATCFSLSEKKISFSSERRIGIFMLLLFIFAFCAQMINEWYALYKQILRIRPGGDSFISGLKVASVGFLAFMIPGKLLPDWEDILSNRDGETREAVSVAERSRSSSGSRSSGSTDKPWLKQLREMAKASFSKDGGGPTDPSSTQYRSFFWSGNRSGISSMASTSDSKPLSKGLYRDLESIFSSK